MRWFLTSIPKSGTHLLRPVLEALGRCESERLGKDDARTGLLSLANAAAGGRHGHVRYDRDLIVPEDTRIVVLIRDPRDIVLSMRDFIFRSRHPGFVALSRRLAPLDRGSQLVAIADGVAIPGFGVARIERHCGGFLEWTDRGAAVLRYEEIVGPAGDRAVAAAIGAPELATDVRRALDGQLSSTSGLTFNIGGSRWRKEMPGDIARHIESRGNIVAHLGYPPSDP